MRRFWFALMLLTLTGRTASAQRRQRVFTSDPDYWVSGGIAGFTGNRVNDGRSASTWEFGDAWNWQYSASLEKTFATGGTSFGVAASYARVPFSYIGPAVPINGVPGTTCTRCDAHLDMTTVAATLHIGAGAGLHGVYEFTGGIINYANLKRDSDGAGLAPGSNTDPMFSFGWGLGYGFDDRTQLEFVPAVAIGVHERTGLANGVGNTNRLSSFRVTLRKGFGNRSLRR